MSLNLQNKPSEYRYWASILIPMFNEFETINFVLNRLKKAMVGLRYEIIIVDDGSFDGSKSQVQTFIALNPHMNIQYIHQENMGKGGAIRTAMQHASGEILVVQDADLEYNPQDILPLLKAFEEGARVVYGSRNLDPENREHSSIWFYWGGLLVTHVTNLLFGSRLTDEATGYKLFHASIMNDLSFEHNDFAWEPELTAKILKKNIVIVEKPISYKPRSASEGKKISWIDGVKAVWVLFTEYMKK